MSGGRQGSSGRHADGVRSARGGGWDDERHVYVSAGSAGERARRPGQQVRRDPSVRGGQRNQGRPRVAAVVVLVVIAVVIAVTGIFIGNSDASTGSGEPIPFSVLPFPENIATPTTTQ